MRASLVTPWRDHLELFPDFSLATAGAAAAGHEVLVVDDGSEPELEFAAIRFEESRGYCRASNAGLEAASGDFVLFLNNDIRARRGDWLDKLLEQAEPGVLVGAKLRFDQHGDVDGQRFPYLDGWCLGGMRSELLELGGFSERLEEPAYFADNELCFRARLAGLRLREVRVGLTHKVGKTTDDDRAALRRAFKINQELFQHGVRKALKRAVPA